ncbi:hypothetical protein MAQ5080_00515 [Marinomonas aquimarina]|uniref:Uncharacterized protein n=1 Tax=Marinomonas aquimarina TaxID=295068 RepID=A0A1A8T2V8_9GAMM|nr:hypothetical protein [Marinomonas aquimarina]SBS26422.1 hypothetical protein MAQ5080_00515 [Marinomonas aquimarina]
MVGRAASGFFLLEALLAMAILTSVVSLIVPVVQALESHMTKRQQLLQLMALNQAVEDQFQAQFQRLGSGGCYASHGRLQVGEQGDKPARLKNDKLDPGSDWLYGTDFGACAGYGWSNEQHIEVQLSCDNLDVGDILRVSSCEQNVAATVLANNHGMITSWHGETDLTGEVLVYDAKEFYWFVKMGKAEQHAFWRRPAPSGRPLELMTGVEHVRFYPVVDRDLDGVADEVWVDYGAVPVRQIKAILVEYLYGLGHCDMASAVLSYQTLRGDQWDYDGVCFKVGKLLAQVGASQ